MFGITANQVQKNIATLQAQFQQPLGAKKFNFYPTTEKEYYKSQNEIVKCYQANVNTFLASKLNLQKELNKDLNSVSMPKAMCVRDLNSGFWSSNIENKGWGIQNLGLWKTHMTGLYHLIANSIWFKSFGNNIFTKAMATITTFLVGLFELTGIATLGMLKFLRKMLTSIPAALLFVAATITAGLAWIFAKLFGAANPADWAKQQLAKVRAFFHRTPAPQPNFIQRHPRLVKGVVLGAAAAATAAGLYYYRAPIGNVLSSALAGVGTAFTSAKNYLGEMEPSKYWTAVKDTVVSKTATAASYIAPAVSYATSAASSAASYATSAASSMASYASSAASGVKNFVWATPTRELNACERAWESVKSVFSWVSMLSASSRPANA